MNPNVFFMWLQFVQSLATAYATSQGQDVRALKYLRVATNVVQGARVDEVKLVALMQEYQAKVANQTPTTAEELEELDRRLAELSADIQAA